MEDSAAGVDAFLADVPQPARACLQELRETIRSLLPPDATEGISYGIPAFRYRGRAVAGYAASKSFCSYYPHSGSVIGELGDQVKGFEGTKSALHFTAERPLPRSLVEALIGAKLRQLEADPSAKP